MWTFRNPIFPGFNPDPSIYRVGEGYRLFGSTLPQLSPDSRWLAKNLSEKCSPVPCETLRYRWNFPRAVRVTNVGDDCRCHLGGGRDDRGLG